MSKANIRDRITTETTYRTRTVTERVELIVMGQGRQTAIFVGKGRGGIECLAMLEGEALEKLAEEILDRRSRPNQPWR